MCRADGGVGLLHEDSPLFFPYGPGSQIYPSQFYPYPHHATTIYILDENLPLGWVLFGLWGVVGTRIWRIKTG